jgi:hypothetical protein
LSVSIPPIEAPATIMSRVAMYFAPSFSAAYRRLV